MFNAFKLREERVKTIVELIIKTINEAFPRF